MFVRIQLALGIVFMNTTIASAAELQEVASFPDKQLTGVGVSTRSGRIFVNFPYWSDNDSISVGGDGENVGVAARADWQRNMIKAQKTFMDGLLIVTLIRFSARIREIANQVRSLPITLRHVSMIDSVWFSSTSPARRS
jgi:hypothetical protein